MNEVLRFDSVTKLYGNIVAVDKSTFTVERGAFVALLGPSGCGKTTTLRLIAGFEEPDAGAIYLEGLPVAGVPAHRRPVNTVFQDYGLFPHMTDFGNIAFGPKLKKVSPPEIEQRVGEMLQLVRLAGMEKRRPYELSGGQQQRVALARALVNRPTILLLDEPLSNLDYKLRKEMRVELKRIQREVNITFVFVTHDQEEALTLADYIIVMDAGRIQQMGQPLTLYRAPANIFVADFIGTANFLKGTLTSRSDTHVRVILDGLASPVMCPHSALESGTAVVLCVRAESIGLSKERPPDHLNALAGKVEETLYLGDHSDLVVRLPNASIVQCQQFHRGGEVPFGVGQDVYVVWTPDETFVFDQRL